MGAGGHLVPVYGVPGPVRAKDRVRRVLGVGVGVVAAGGHDGFGVVAGVVPGGQHAPAAQAVGVGGDFARVAARRSHRQAAGQAGGAAQRLGRVKAAAQALDVGHRAAHGVGGQFQRKGVPRFQQLHGVLRGRCAQALAHRAVGGLAEIPALGML